MKVRARLSLVFLALVALGFCALVFWITDELGPRYLATMEESMVDEATVLSSFLETRLDGQGPDIRDLRILFEIANRKEFSAKIYEMTKERLNLRVYVTDSRGIVLFDSDNGKAEGEDYSRWRDVSMTLRGEYGARTTPHFSDDPEGSSLYVASPVKANGEIVGVLTVCKPSRSVLLFLTTARRQIAVAGIVAALAVAALTLVVSTWITRPIERLTQYAIAIRDGRRVPPPRKGTGEIGELAGAFEEMKNRLEGRQYVENYVQTLTHEMKSPLSAIRGAVELLNEEMPVDQRAGFLENIRAETDRMRDLVDRLLQLSAVEQRSELQEVEELDLASLLQEVAGSMRATLRAQQISIVVGGDSPVPVRGERFLLRQALANLLQNATEFSPPGSAIHVDFKSGGQGAEVCVRDEGPGIPDYALNKVFDRFYSLRRPDTGKKSSGLGLTFVREAMLLHGGQATLRNAPEGGAEATLKFPRARS